MTQVKEWSNQELNRALAELMGWKIKTTTDGEREFYDDGGFCSGKWVEPATLTLHRTTQTFGRHAQTLLPL